MLKSRLDEVAKLYPDIESWIDWWHERRSHIFVPFRGGGLPGVNLSEQGNAGWIRCMMSPIRAAKEDFATMVLQERRMYMFNNNLQASDGKGAQSSRELKLRAQQEMEADEFVDILDNDYAIIRVPTFLHSQNSRILYKIPGIIFFLNVASTCNWVSVYTLYITSTPFCLYYPKVCIPPLTAIHNDLYHFERWVLIKKKNRNK